MSFANFLLETQTRHQARQAELDATLNTTLLEAKQAYMRETAALAEKTERLLLALAPLQEVLDQLPPHLKINADVNNDGVVLKLVGATETDLDALLFELAPLPIAIDPRTQKMKQPDPANDDEATFTGLYLRAKADQVHLAWETQAGDMVYQIECPLSNTRTERWSVPSEVGPPVVDFHGSLWLGTHDFYVQPLNANAKKQLDAPVAWRNEADWNNALHNAFEEQWPVKPNAAAKLVLNALLAWSKTPGIPLPTVDDLRQWPTKESNVVMLKPLLSDMSAVSSAHAHVQRIAQKLPGLGQYLANEHLPQVVEAMRRTRASVVERNRSTDVAPSF